VRHTCHWTGCTREVPPSMWGCKPHWFKLPKVLRDAIWAAYRPGQEIDKKPSDRYIATAALVQNWIAGKVEIRKDGSIFLTGDIQVGEHTLPVSSDGRLA
jgi:hypothetical protein